MKLAIELYYKDEHKVTLYEILAGSTNLHDLHDGEIKQVPFTSWDTFVACVCHGNIGSSCIWPCLKIEGPEM